MKAIRHNVPSRVDKTEFGAEANFTFHTNDVVVYFDRIREDNSGYVFMKYDAEVAFVAEGDTDVSPVVAQEHARETPGEKIPFADE